MMMFETLLVLAVQISVAQGDLGEANREGVRSALLKAHIAVDRIGHCTEVSPRREAWETSYSAALPRLLETSAEVEELYPDIDATSDAVLAEMALKPPKCTVKYVRSMEIEARQALTEAAHLMGKDAAPRSGGLWVGNLRICRERVLGIEDADPRFANDGPRLLIRFSQAFSSRMEALTRRRVNKALSLVLDGRVISRPTVMEPIRDEVIVDVPEGVSPERFRRAASTAC